MSKLLRRDELQYLLFGEIYHRFIEPKAKRKALHLLEAAIQCFARKGFDQVSLEMIAREAGVTRPLIKHYYRDLKDVELHALKYIRVVFQKLAIDGLTSSDDPALMLSNYIDACLKWTENFRAHVIVWFAFLQRCARNSKSRKLNTLAVLAGEERIQALIEKGVAQKRFVCRDVAETAKAIQVLIFGAVITAISEDLDSQKKFSLSIQQKALQFLNANTSQTRV